MLNLSVPARLPIFSRLCDVSKGKFTYIHPDEAANTTRCNDNALGQISCQTPNLKEHLSDVDGLELESIEAIQPVSPEGVPGFIPVIDRDFFDHDGRDIQLKTIGISLEDIFQTLPVYSRGCYHVKNLHVVDRLLEYPLFREKQVVLFSSGRDSLMESFWTDYVMNGYIDRIRGLGFASVTALNLSLFLGGCAVGQYYNLKRSLLSFHDFQEAGISSVPHLYWFSRHQLNYWANWLQKNPLVKLVTINCQLYRPDEFYIVREGIKHLHNVVGPDLHFLLEGPKMRFLEELKDISSRIHFTAKWLSSSARNFHGVQYDGEKLQKCTTNSRDDRFRLLVGSINAYKQYHDDHFFNSVDPLNNILGGAFRIAKYEPLGRRERVAAGAGGRNSPLNPLPPARQRFKIGD